jgi:hypothetical protein
LSGERGSAAATENGSAIFASEGDGGDYVVSIPREDHANGDLTVVGSVGGVEGASAVVETDLAADILAEIGCQAHRVHLHRFGGAGEF